MATIENFTWQILLMNQYALYYTTFFCLVKPCLSTKFTAYNQIPCRTRLLFFFSQPMTAAPMAPAN